MPTLSVSVRAAEAGGWNVHWELDGKLCGQSFVLAPQTVLDLDLIAQCFDPAPDPAGGTARGGGVFSSQRSRGHRAAALRGSPRAAWGAAADPPAEAATLLVRTDCPDVLNLPWELLPLGTGGGRSAPTPSGACTACRSRPPARAAPPHRPARCGCCFSRRRDGPRLRAGGGGPAPRGRRGEGRDRVHRRDGQRGGVGRPGREVPPARGSPLRPRRDAGARYGRVLLRGRARASGPENRS